MSNLLSDSANDPAPGRPTDPAPERRAGESQRLLRLLAATVTCLAGLLILWELWLAPVRDGGSWLALKALPLALALPGLARRVRYTRQWLSLLLPFYFAEGVVRAFSEAGRVRILSLAEVVLAAVAFAAIIMLARARGKPGDRDL